MITENRQKHSLAVARKMVEIGKSMGLKANQLTDLFLIGYNHDIGYEFSDKTGKEHNKIGGYMLKQAGFKFWEEIFYHGEPKIDGHSKNLNILYLNFLNQADMQIYKNGQDVGTQKRLQDIKDRYGADSEVYKKCILLVNQAFNYNQEERSL